MSTGLDCYIRKDERGWSFGIEDPNSNSLDPDYFEEGPFATVGELVRAFNRHANPGGWSFEGSDGENTELMAAMNASWKR